MSLKIILLLLGSLAIFSADMPGKKIQPTFPPDLPENKKDKFMEQWTAGKLLFKADCAKCHGVFGKSKDTIPDFMKVQLHRYTARFIARDPKNHSVVQKIPMEDFTRIMLFLTYLKRNKEDDRGPLLFGGRDNQFARILNGN
jgi:hypothetical protein